MWGGGQCSLTAKKGRVEGVEVLHGLGQPEGHPHLVDCGELVLTLGRGVVAQHLVETAPLRKIQHQSPAPSVLADALQLDHVPVGELTVHIWSDGGQRSFFFLFFYF